MLYVYGKTMGWTSRVTQPVRWAGQQLLDLDARYADALYRDGMNPVVAMAGTTPLSQIPGYTDRLDDSLRTRIMTGAMDAGIGASNIAARYALPAGGVTLAAKALMDLTNQFNTQLAEAPEPGQLSMNSSVL